MRELGRSVPSDVSIVAVSSSIEMGEMVDPVLTVLEAPARELGQLGIDALIDQLEGVDTSRRQVLLPCTLVLGESTAPPPRARPRRGRPRARAAIERDRSGPLECDPSASRIDGEDGP
ncbi:substrate-binding domain-containing protein [Pseudolysinimonas kribbensis]|uniref:substrate-binding domain-containing protein n=1 Tax=Pseudolysinimonas kribbensis TaxID=433641 RepID=UPI003D67D822